MSEDQKKKRRKKNYLLRLIIIVAILAGAGVLMHIDYFDVNGVAVIGNEDISDEEILRLSGIEMGKSIFDVHPFIVEHRIRKNLYIDEVNVDRKLPDKVEIRVTERRGNAQFIMGKKYVVTDNEGQVIDISDEEMPATLVENIKVTGATNGGRIEVRDSGELEKALNFIRLTEDNDLFFKRLSISKNHVEAHVFDELVCVGKYADFESCIQSGTLKSVLYDLYQKGTEKGTVNVYKNDYCFFTP
ncbi:MAG: FtsQ-type POTRA domain-containing protein [Clostridia bacterium]|nr:FtsQ-type POTRA domain-containing protein [Clostridia bacterium]